MTNPDTERKYIEFLEKSSYSHNIDVYAQAMPLFKKVLTDKNFVYSDQLRIKVLGLVFVFCIKSKTPDPNLAMIIYNLLRDTTNKELFENLVSFIKWGTETLDKKWEFPQEIFKTLLSLFDTTANENKKELILNVIIEKYRKYDVQTFENLILLSKKQLNEQHKRSICKAFFGIIASDKTLKECAENEMLDFLATCACNENDHEFQKLIIQKVYLVLCMEMDRNVEYKRLNPIWTKPLILALEKGIANDDNEFVECLLEFIDSAIFFQEEEERKWMEAFDENNASQVIENLVFSKDEVISMKASNLLILYFEEEDGDDEMQQIEKTSALIAQSDFTLKMREQCSSQNPKGIFSTADELLSMVLSFSDFSDLVKCSSVCKHWYNFVSNFQLLTCGVSLKTWNPILTKSECQENRRNNYKQSYNMIPLIVRMGHLIYSLPVGAFSGVYMGIYQFLPNLRELNGTFSTEKLDYITRHCIHLKKVHLRFVGRTCFKSLFLNCKQLEEFSVTTPTITTLDLLSNETLEILAENTLGNLKVLNFSWVKRSVDFEALAKVIRKSPLLETLVFLHTPEIITSILPFSNPNPVIEALASYKKKYKNIGLNWITNKDQELLDNMITK